MDEAFLSMGMTRHINPLLYRKNPDTQFLSFLSPFCVLCYRLFVMVYLFINTINYFIFITLHSTPNNSHYNTKKIILNLQNVLPDKVDTKIGLKIENRYD